MRPWNLAVSLLMYDKKGEIDVFMKKDKNTEYAQLLVEYVKEVGKYLQEHAEDIVPNTPLIGDFSLDITFDQECGSWPKLYVSTTAFPGRFERFNELTEIVKNKYAKEN